MSQTTFDRKSPYGHDAVHAEQDDVLLVEVVVRPNLGPVLLNDGRAYASGTHQIQIYAKDLDLLNERVETEPHLVKAAEQRYKMLLGRYIKENPAKNVPGTFTKSVTSIFHEENFRGIKPLLSVTPLDNLGTLQSQSQRKALELAKSISSGGSNVAASPEVLTAMAAMLATIEKLNAKIDGIEIKEAKAKAGKAPKE